jgi:splicing factor U2AF subunit
LSMFPFGAAPGYPQNLGGGFPGGGGGMMPGDAPHCAFFRRMGACRHGEFCQKKHFRPQVCDVLLLPMLYPNPLACPLSRQADETSGEGAQESVEIPYDPAFLKKHFEEFYEDLFLTLLKFGEISDIVVLENTCEHLLGNVYIRFKTVEGAVMAHKNLTNMTYHGTLILPEFSPVTDFFDATCKQQSTSAMCDRLGSCNFHHPIYVNAELLERLRKQQALYLRARARIAEKRLAQEGGGKGERDERDRRHDRDDRGERRGRFESGGRGTGGDSFRPPPPAPGAAGSGLQCNICAEFGHIGKECPMIRRGR